MKIAASAPSRIGLFGGGSDLPVFYEEYDGLVISMAINLRQHMVFDTKAELTTACKIPSNANIDFYRKTFGFLGVAFPDDLFASFDGHIQSGLGTSASAAVLMAEIARRIKNEPLDRVKLAEQAWDVEVNKLKMYGGKQDQYAAAYGGMNTLYFGKNGVLVDPWDKSRATALVNQMLLFYIGEGRKDTKIQEELLTLTEEQENSIREITLCARMATTYIWRESWNEVAQLLGRSWEAKKRSNPKVTTPKIDEIYESAIASGAVGGKLCGSGGGGHMVFMGPPDKHSDITNKLVSLGCTPVDFDISWDGVESRVLEV